jgi:hypothetical protein
MREIVNPGKLVTETGAEYRARMAREADAAVEAATVEQLAAVVVTPEPATPAVVKGKVTKPKPLTKPKKK